jgi:hypothetical protein
LWVASVTALMLSIIAAMLHCRISRGYFPGTRQ